MTHIFDRYVPIMDRSFSLRTFNRYETEINAHFWSFKVISEYSGYIARHVPDRRALTASVFKAKGPDSGRIPTTVSDWLNARKELENWLRLSALVSANSYLEAYLRQIIRSALMSDPLCRHKKTRVLDGIALLKRNVELPYSYEVEKVTRGEWNVRLAEFSKIFGGRPSGIESYISTLERIRKIRNDFAHGFGRELAAPHPSNYEIKPSMRLSQRTFVKYIGSISKSAAIFDRFILERHIGNFEILHFYHAWKLRKRDPRDTKYSVPHALKRCLAREPCVVTNTKFCAALIEYYDSL